MNSFLRRLLIVFCFYSSVLVAGNLKDPIWAYIFSRDGHVFRETKLSTIRVDFNLDGTDDIAITSNESFSSNGRALQYWNLYLSDRAGGYTNTINIATAGDPKFYKAKDIHESLVLVEFIPNGAEGYSVKYTYLDVNEIKTVQGYESTNSSGSNHVQPIALGESITAKREVLDVKNLLSHEDFQRLGSRNDFLYERFDIDNSSDQELVSYHWSGLIDKNTSKLKGYFQEEALIFLFDDQESEVYKNDVVNRIKSIKGEVSLQNAKDYKLYSTARFINYGGSVPYTFRNKDDKELTTFNWYKLYAFKPRKWIGLVHNGHRTVIEFEDDANGRLIRENIIKNQGIYKPWQLAEIIRSKITESNDLYKSNQGHPPNKH